MSVQVNVKLPKAVKYSDLPSGKYFTIVEKDEERSDTVFRKVAWPGESCYILDVDLAAIFPPTYVGPEEMVNPLTVDSDLVLSYQYDN